MSRTQTPPNTERLFDRLPPHSQLAEMALLGAILLDHNMLGVATEAGIVTESFYLEVHQEMFTVLSGIVEATGQIDATQLAARLNNSKLLAEAGGDDYFGQILNSVASVVGTEFYAATVAKLATIRNVSDLCSTTLHAVYKANEDDAEEVLEEFKRQADAIILPNPGGSSTLLSVLVMDEYDKIERADGTPRGTATGLYDLDNMLGGLHDSELVVVAARPSMGKTALALNMTQSIAERGGHVGVFSMEMSKESLAHRLIGTKSGQPMADFRAGRKIPEKQLDEILAACEGISKWPVTIEDDASLTIGKLCTLARRMVADQGVRVLVIDYLQLLTSSGRKENRQTEVSDISRKVKGLARDLCVPVVCLSQLNRASEQRAGNRPRLSDLRESGAIEQDADVVMLLHREDYYHIGDAAWAAANPELEGAAELIVGKNRNGPTGSVKLMWNARTMQFVDGDGR